MRRAVSFLLPSRQLEETLGALEVKLSDEVLARLDEISRPFV